MLAKALAVLAASPDAASAPTAGLEDAVRVFKINGPTQTWKWIRAWRCSLAR